MLAAILIVVLVPILAYILFLVLFFLHPGLQAHVIYLHAVKPKLPADGERPERQGFLRNQVTPFTIPTPDGETLSAWHVLPLGLYRRHREALSREVVGLQLLRDDPGSLVVLAFHGAAGTLATGFRPQAYRAMSALGPDKIHVVAVDYRGFGSSTGSPSEVSLTTDAVAAAEWVMSEAGIPPSRIVLFGQSLGAAVVTALAHHYAIKQMPECFSGVVLIAPFVNVEELASTFRIEGVFPLLGPLGRFPRLLGWLNTFIRAKWDNKKKLAVIVRALESSRYKDMDYFVNLIHAEDDSDVPSHHSETLFWHAARSTIFDGESEQEFQEAIYQSKNDNRYEGWSIERRTKKGLIRGSFPRHGLHAKIMTYPVVSQAVFEAFHHEKQV
ncbi:hypothetical protein ACJ41O_006395 [Fusarium nematophilum]